MTCKYKLTIALCVLIFVPLCSFGQEISREFYESGNVYGEGPIVNGLMEGKWKIFYETGELAAEIIFIKGVVNGQLTQYYKNGKIKKIGQVVDGSNEGESIYYYESGNIYCETNYLNNKRHGNYRFYYENGNLMETGIFILGKRNGLVKSYDNSGKIIKEKNFSGLEKSPEEIFENLSEYIGNNLGDFEINGGKGTIKVEKGEEEKSSFFVKLIKSVRWFYDFTYTNPFYSIVLFIVISAIFKIIKGFKP